jgi:hypothetical protein
MIYIHRIVSCNPQAMVMLLKTHLACCRKQMINLQALKLEIQFYQWLKKRLKLQLLIQTFDPTPQIYFRLEIR